MVRIMIREGEDMNDVTTHMGNTPMHFAARNGHYLVVKYLLELGAQADLVNKQGLTPLKVLLENKVAEERLNAMRRKLEAMKHEKDKEKVKMKTKMSSFLDKQRLISDTYELLFNAEKGVGQRA